MNRKLKRHINQRARQKRGNLAMSHSEQKNVEIGAVILNKTLVCHPSMMDVCKIKHNSGDGIVGIYSAVALHGEYYVIEVPVSELSIATEQEIKTGMRNHG